MPINSEEVFEIAKNNMPAVEVNIKNNMLRHGVANYLNGEKNIGIELGIAQGVFSQRMIDSGKFHTYFGVDVYGDSYHNTNEYKTTLKRLGLTSNHKLLRMTFDDALELFEDNYFDFVYVDGFAHTGEEGGKTLIDWFKKVKVGGILAGDDYDDEWPLVKWAVNDFISKTGFELHVTGGKEDTTYCLFPTWFIIKTKDCEVEINPLLAEIGNNEKIRIYNKNMGISDEPKVSEIIPDTSRNNFAKETPNDTETQSLTLSNRISMILKAIGLKKQL